MRSGVCAGFSPVLLRFSTDRGGVWRPVGPMWASARDPAYCGGMEHAWTHHFDRRSDERAEPGLLELAYRRGLPIVATNECFFPHREDYEAHDALLAIADVVAINLVLTPETRGLIDARRLKLMKRGAVLVNTSRGPIVDEPALIAALESGHLGGAALAALLPMSGGDPAGALRLGLTYLGLNSSGGAG